MELKEVLHLYLGCEVTDGEDVMTLTSVGLYGYTAANKECKSQGIFKRIKPILRPLSDMTEEEWKSIIMEFSIDVVNAYNSYTRYGDKPKHVLILENRLNTNTLKFNDGMILLRKHFDLFGLIESGQAIDKTTINNKK